MPLVYIALGSNLGDREKNIQQALLKMQKAGLVVKKVASCIETLPYGGVDQPNFLNSACLVQTELTPLEVLEILQAVENSMGRVRTVHWGPRVIDLDILLYDDFVLHEPSLQIPHPDMLNRVFVLQPLLELDSELLHPLTGEKIKERLKELMAKR